MHNRKYCVMIFIPSMLATKLNMTPEEAEKWIVNLIRNVRLDARIDAKQVPSFIAISDIYTILFLCEGSCCDEHPATVDIPACHRQNKVRGISNTVHSTEHRKKTGTATIMGQMRNTFIVFLGCKIILRNLLFCLYNNLYTYILYTVYILIIVSEVLLVYLWPSIVIN